MFGEQTKGYAIEIAKVEPTARFHRQIGDGTTKRDQTFYKFIDTWIGIQFIEIDDFMCRYGNTNWAKVLKREHSSVIKMKSMIEQPSLSEYIFGVFSFVGASLFRLS